MTAHQPWRWLLARLLAVAAALALAAAIDWLVAPIGYPVAAIYGAALLLAAHLLAPAVVAVVAGLALLLSAGSNFLQHAPTGAAATSSAGLLAIGVLAVLLARQRQVTEAARGRLELQYAAARALAEEPSVEDAASAVLGAIARHLGWMRGALWYRDAAGTELRCLATWRAA